VVVLDFETTGLVPSESRVIEVAAVIVANGRPAAEFVQLVNPGFAIPPFITHLTGITTEMIQDQPRAEAIIPSLLDFIGNRPIVAHNASFDVRFLQAELRRIGLTIDNPVVCTMRLARRLISNVPGYSLTRLRTHLNIGSGIGAHRALADVLVTIELWHYLCSQVRDKSGVHCPGIDVLQRITSLPKRKVPPFLAGLAEAAKGTAVSSMRNETLTIPIAP
jgi:DNA polymerase III subunit epsilon